MVNTIVAANTEGVGSFSKTKGDIDREATSFSNGQIANNLVGDNDAWPVSGTNSIMGTTANPINPMLGALQNNGGPTQTMALLTGSPAIDKGNNSFAVDQNNNPLSYDQRGTGYPRIFNTTVDIGAFKVSLPPVVVAPTTLPTGIVGGSYSQTLTASGGTGSGYTFMESGNLPTGINFTNGNFSGTPTQSGTFNITVTATDGNKDSGSQAYTLTINPALTLGPSSVPAAAQSNTYSVIFSGSGGSVSGYTYTETGALPAGITFNNGQLSGTPTIGSGSFSFTVQVKDSLGDTASSNYTLTVESAIVISPAAGPVGTVNNVYNQATAFSATGGSGSGFTFAETGTVPGLAFNTTTHTFTGTPTQSGTFPITIIATDGKGAIGKQNYSLTINPALTLSPTSLPFAIVGNAYSQTLKPGGGSGSGYKITESGTLPTGMNFSNGVFSGTPTQSGTFNITVSVTDSNNATGSQNYILTVGAALSLGPASIPMATVNHVYAVTFSGSGGSRVGYTYTETGTLPAGITFSGNRLAGTPSATGTFTFTVQVTDSIGDTASNNYTLTVDPAISISPTTLPVGTVNNAYNQTTTLSASGGSGSGYSLSESGTLPNGLFFNAGLFSGTPTQSGSFTITITATDSNGATGSQTYSLIVDPPLALSPATLPIATVSNLYNHLLTVAGGSGTGYTFAETGSLPSGITFSAGTFSGTPDQAGSFPITIAITDGAQGSVSQNYMLVVDPALNVGPSALPATAENDPYYFPLSAAGGSGSSYIFSHTGNMPAGLGFSGNVLTGVATSSPGIYNFTIIVTDSNGGTASQNYSLSVTAPIRISPTALPVGIRGYAYPQTTLVASGGSTTGYIFSEAGPLPVGMSFNQVNATLSGTPTQYGAFNFQVSVTDSKGGTTIQSYALTVNFNLGPSPEARFVDAVYQQLLYRPADPGAQVWVNLLDSGRSPSSVIQSVEQSTEYLGNVVTGIYQHYLGRLPDFGAAAWINALAGGTSIESVTASIVSSNEYFANHGGTNAGYINGLYQDILGRLPDSGGFNSWMAFLNGGGSRHQTALTFLISKERYSDLVEWDYQHYLGRAADAGGLASWVGALQGGLSDQSVLAAIFGSAEGYNHWA